VKRNGELIELTVTGIEESAESLLESESSDHPQDIAPASRLGLLKEHVELLLGHVHVISRPGKGSDITVCVPCA
jgi:hypothetical protein